MSTIRHSLQRFLLGCAALVGCHAPVSEVPVDGAGSDSVPVTDGLVSSPECEACRKSSFRPCVCTLAGTGIRGFTDGANAQARFTYPWRLAYAAPDTLLVSDLTENRIRAIARGRTWTLAGGNNSHVGGGIEGPALSVWFGSVRGMVVEPTGRVLVADTFRIASIHNGWVQTWAGQGWLGPDQDGGLREVRLGITHDLALDGQGRVFVLEKTPHTRLRVIEGARVRTLFQPNFPGCLAGPLSQARMQNYTEAVATDSRGRVYVADYGCDRIWVVEGNEVQALAGQGRGFADGPNANAKFDHPADLLVGPRATLYVADVGNHRIRKIRQGTTSTVAGDGVRGHRDGPGPSARFVHPFGLAMDSAGNLYVADPGDYRVRVVLMK